MALEATFGRLAHQLYELRSALTDLRTTTVEDKPLEDDIVLVDILSDAVDDLLGWSEGALAAALEAQQAVAPLLDLQGAGRALVACQSRFQTLVQHFATDLAGYERIAEVLRCGRRRGGEWHAWARSVHTAIDRTRQPLAQVGEELVACWQELIEHTGGTTIGVRTTTIGPHLVLQGAPGVPAKSSFE
jgi:hypothetical protein